MSDQTLTNQNAKSRVHSENRSDASVNQEPLGQNDDLDALFGIAEDSMMDDVWSLEADLEESLAQVDEQDGEKSVAVQEQQITNDKRQAEAVRQAEAAKKAEAVRQAEAAKRAEAVRQAEAAKRAEAVKKAEAVKRAEAVKKAEAVRQAEVAKRAEAVREAEAVVDAETVMEAQAVVEEQVVVEEPVVAEEQAAVESDLVVDVEETIHGWEKIKEIAQQVVEQKQEVKESVRTLIGWFGAKRRGSYVNECIQRELEKGQIRTEPDFADAYIDTVVRFIPVENSFTGTVNKFHDPTFRISKLPSADMTLTESSVKEGTALISISPDATVKEATTLMMINDFSQLPVMTSSREVKGVISWESIGKHAALNNICGKVRDCMTRTVPEVKSDSSMFSAIELIVRHGFVLVRQQDKVVSGIVTTTDLSLQFRQLAEPFLLVGEIENYIRFLLEKFPPEQLQSARDPRDERPIQGVADLSFGEYVRLLENPENWKILDIPIDRTIFGKRLDRIRELRNEIMHFDPDPFDPKDLETLRLFANFIRTVYINRNA